ncbi:uncharacterized protein TRUGW13939_01762 [Talaromyces rugulosus]|uniref:Uncharacterized protein n=1 Tax=Talaromyces rugulosus TaxID=121627 RepID=A0A7H8QL75_TALRU|nr:uncharacterized protein TRUGW13939_01762 [Talaromyces rugulosus]QKX54674.1 hypothetical protein TRUGW13939_01762 [Talaromyces rugulosus]
MLLKRASKTLLTGSEYERFGSNSEQFKRPNFRGAKFDEKLQNEITCRDQKEPTPAEENRDLRTKIHELKQTMLERDGEHRQNKKSQKDYLPFNTVLWDFIDFTEKEYLTLREKLRRVQEMSAKAEKDHVFQTSQHQKAISDLSQKLNVLQPRGNTLYDEQCTEEWRGLRRRLGNWVSKSFGNAAVLNAMTSNSLISRGVAGVPPNGSLEKSAHTRRAYIQSFISHFIFQEILSVLFVQVPDVQISQAFHTMAQHVKSQGDRQLWEQWRSSTSTALECFNKSKHSVGKLTELLDKMDHYFGEFYDRNMSRKLVHDKLSQVFWDCVGLKQKLERGESDYQFVHSEQGTPYSKENMNSTNSETEEGAVVQLSLWPAMSKISAGNERLLLEHEAVWTLNTEGGLREKDSIFQEEQHLDVKTGALKTEDVTMEDGDTQDGAWILWE